MAAGLYSGARGTADMGGGHRRNQLLFHIMAARFPSQELLTAGCGISINMDPDIGTKALKSRPAQGSETGHELRAFRLYFPMSFADQLGRIPYKQL